VQIRNDIICGGIVGNEEIRGW